MSWSIVKQSTQATRRIVLVAFTGVAVILASHALERLVFQGLYAEAAQRNAQAERSVGRILLFDNRLTMSALLAAASGELRWIERYEDEISSMDEAIKSAIALAPVEVAERFDGETRLANDVLVAMERRAFGEVRAGRLMEARAILDGSAYAAQKAVLADGTSRFVAGLVSATEQNLGAVRDMAIMSVGLLTLVGFGLLWLFLSRSLTRSEATFVEAERRIHDLAMTDSLTELPNRRAFALTLAKSVAQVDANGGHIALLSLDLDRFKPINDLYGHGAGDEVLRTVAQRLNALVGTRGQVSRLGGDEFGVVLAYGDIDEALGIAHRITDHLHEPIRIGSNAAQIGASVGIATYPSDAAEIETLRRNSDLALYAAKKAGRGNVRRFETAMADQTSDRAQLESDLPGAIRDGQIVPYFQPLVRLETSEIIGFEVLARWIHPTRGMVGPDVFVALAQEMGLITDMTLSVLHQACRAAAQWPVPLPVALNIAPQQLQDRWLPEKLLGVLSAQGFPPGRLEIEITEDALVADFDMARRVIVSLKNQGVSIALDDFGAGCSSLAHLSQLPIDKIKIDRSFIGPVAESAHSAAIVSTVVGLGRSLSMSTTAEGIETAELAERLLSLGCETGQGYLYSRPIPAGQTLALLNTRGTNLSAEAKAKPLSRPEPVALAS